MLLVASSCERFTMADQRVWWRLRWLRETGSVRLSLSFARSIDFPLTRRQGSKFWTVQSIRRHVFGSNTECSHSPRVSIDVSEIANFVKKLTLTLSVILKWTADLKSLLQCLETVWNTLKCLEMALLWGWNRLRYLEMAWSGPLKCRSTLFTHEDTAALGLKWLIRMFIPVFINFRSLKFD